MTRLPLAGATNFRDFGGYAARDNSRLKSGVLYRSDRLSALTPEDYALLSPLNFRRVFDLRRVSEAEAAPTVWLSSAGPAIVSMPLFTDEAGPTTIVRIMNDAAARNDPNVSRARMRDLYRNLVQAPSAQSAYRAIFAMLAEAEHYPIVVHCSAGKDRTGIVCALIHGALGVSRDDIVADYMLTDKYYDGAKNLAAITEQMFKVNNIEDWNIEAMKPVLAVEASYIEAALDTISSQYGSASAYLESLGVTEGELQKISDALLERA